MKGDMARSGAGWQFQRLRQAERTRGRIQRVEVDHVCAQIGHDRETIIGRGDDHMRMGYILPIFIGSGGVINLDVLAVFADHAVSVDGIDADIAARLADDIIDHEDIVSASVYTNVGGRGSGGRLPATSESRPSASMAKETTCTPASIVVATRKRPLGCGLR